MDIHPQSSSNTGQDDRLLAALSYVYFLAPIILLMKKGNEFVAFHARQGLVLLIASIILWFIPVIGWFLNAVVFVAIVIGFIMSLNGTKWRMPGVGAIAERLKF